jgi:hypothetical protein
MRQQKNNVFTEPEAVQLHHESPAQPRRTLCCPEEIEETTSPRIFSGFTGPPNGRDLDDWLNAELESFLSGWNHDAQTG